jgi:hypothetical protein
VKDVEGSGRRVRRGIKGSRDKIEILAGAPSWPRDFSPGWTGVRSSGEREVERGSTAQDSEGDVFSLSASISEPACGIRECPGYLSVLACLRSEDIRLESLRRQGFCEWCDDQVPDSG